MLKKVKKTKKTQKNPRKWIFPEKRQQEKVLRICSSICVQIFSQIQWFIFEIVSGAPLIGVCNRWYDGLGSGPLPRLAKFFWGLICPDHLAMERFRALLVKGLNKTAQLLLMDYEKKLNLALLCKLFRDSTINIITLPSKCLWWLPST